MPTNNAKGLEEVLALLEKATPGEWQADEDLDFVSAPRAGCGDVVCMPPKKSLRKSLERWPENIQAIAAAVNYLRSHGEAWQELIEAATRANGEHTAPHDCYATGPLTGDPYRDLVECPGCRLAAALAKVSNGDTK